MVTFCPDCLYLLYQETGPDGFGSGVSEKYVAMKGQRGKE